MNLLEQFGRIRNFIFDVDGVLTDGTVLVLENGLQARTMSIRDGFALQMAVHNGYRVLIVSGGYSPPVRNRLEKLGITEVHMSIGDKRSFVGEYILQHDWKKEETLFMGDDLPDLPVMEIVGLGCCPADAVPELRNACQYISPLAAGKACARDVIEKVMRIHGKWNHTDGLSSR